MTRQVRRSDVASFCRVWTTAWRSWSAVRPSALNNQGSPWEWACPVQARPRSSWADHSLSAALSNWPSPIAPFHQNVCAMCNRSRHWHQPFCTLSQHPNQTKGSAQSHVKAAGCLHPNTVSAPSIPSPKLSQLWHSFRGPGQASL